ncbi:hypothetical protein DPMN_057680 [Dreissena polymorpha]|uniref:Uncharacterized protein n=1 Tax=Dreissena polymorpha TaxID=45954 RepID=A0A9D4HCG0_DREPO|nr:hypothetical protein DPMN_057680 [Dreissena polymorpha]
MMLASNSRANKVDYTGQTKWTIQSKHSGLYRANKVDYTGQTKWTIQGKQSGLYRANKVDYGKYRNTRCPQNTSCTKFSTTMAVQCIAHLLRNYLG